MIIFSLLIRWERHKRVDQAATPNLFPGQRTLGPACHRSSHTDKTHARTLNDMTLKCLDSHSGWTADAILYIVRSLHHQVFLENLHALRLLATSHVHHRRFTLPAGSKRGCWAGATRRLTLNSFWSDEQRMVFLGEDVLCPGDYCVVCQAWVKNSTFACFPFFNSFFFFFSFFKQYVCFTDHALVSLWGKKKLMMTRHALGWLVLKTVPVISMWNVICVLIPPKVFTSNAPA